MNKEPLKYFLNLSNEVIEARKNKVNDPIRYRNAKSAFSTEVTPELVVALVSSILKETMKQDL